MFQFGIERTESHRGFYVAQFNAGQAFVIQNARGTFHCLLSLAHFANRECLLSALRGVTAEFIRQENAGAMPSACYLSALASLASL